MLTVIMTARMIEIMEIMSQGEQASETARTRVQVLSELLLPGGRGGEGDGVYTIGMGV